MSEQEPLRALDEKQKLLLLVGYGIEAWSLVETALSLIYSRFTGTSIMKAEATLRSIHSLDTRITICQRLGEFPDALESDELREIWRELCVRLLRANRQRNDLAHFSIVNYEGKIRLMPYFSFYKLKEENPTNLGTHDIELRIQAFKDLDDAITWVRHPEWRLRQPPAPQVPEPPLIQEIRALVAQRTASH